MSGVNRVKRVKIYLLTLLSLVVALTSLPLYSAAAEADGPQIVRADSYSPDLVSITYDQPIAATGDNSTISDAQLGKFSFGDPSLKAVYGYVAQNQLFLTLNKAVARDAQYIDIDAAAGAVTGLTGQPSGTVNDYRVLTLSGRLMLQDELDPVGSGITLDRIVKHSNSPDFSNLVGAPGIDREDVRFALTLMDTSLYIYALQSTVPYAESKLPQAAEWNVPAVVVEALRTEINEAKALLANPAKTQRQLDAAYLDLYYAQLQIVPGPQVHSSSSSVPKGNLIDAWSSHDGKVYLVPATQSIGSVADLEQHKVLSAAVTSGLTVKLSSASLTVGESYKLYAVSADNRISHASAIITITEALSPWLQSRGTIASIRIGTMDSKPFVYVPKGITVGELIAGLLSNHDIVVKNGTADVPVTAEVTGDMGVVLGTTTVEYDIRMSVGVSSWSELQAAFANASAEGIIVNGTIANAAEELVLPSRHLWFIGGVSEAVIEAKRFKSSSGSTRDGSVKLIANASTDAELRDELLGGISSHIRLTGVDSFGGGLLSRQFPGGGKQYFANEAAAYVANSEQLLAAWNAGESRIYLTNSITVSNTLSLDSGPSELVASSSVSLTADSYSGAWNGSLMNVTIIGVPQVAKSAYLKSMFPGPPSGLPDRFSDSMIVIEFDQPLGGNGRERVEQAVTDAVYNYEYYYSTYVEPEDAEIASVLDFEWAADYEQGNPDLRIRNNINDVTLEFRENVYAQLGEATDAPYVKILDPTPFMAMVHSPDTTTLTELVLSFSENLHNDTMAATTPEEIIDEIIIGEMAISPTSISWEEDEWDGMKLIIGVESVSYYEEPIAIKFISGRVRNATGEDSISLATMMNLFN